MPKPDLWIDPTTKEIVGPDRDRPYTAEELSRQVWPACPVCGAMVDPSSIETPDYGGPTTYQLTGGWTCQRGCHNKLALSMNE